MKRQQALGALFVVSTVSAAATFVLPLVPSFELIKTVSHSSIQYDSRARTPLYSQTETARAPAEAFSATMKFAPYSTKRFTDLFQTAPLNAGARVELAGSLIALVVAAENPRGFDGYLVSAHYDPLIAHTLHVDINREDHVSVLLDGKQVVDTDSPDLNYAISDVAVGTGFSNARRFSGKISDFGYSYSLYNAFAPSALLLWIRLACYFAAVFALFMIIRIPNVTLSSMFPGPSRGAQAAEDEQSS